MRKITRVGLTSILLLVADFLCVADFLFALEEAQEAFQGKVCKVSAEFSEQKAR